METVDELDPEIARLFAAKEERRRQLAALPIEEKVKIVMQLQRMVAPILRQRGIEARPWPVDSSGDTKGS